jgi:fumarate hydratase class II
MEPTDQELKKAFEEMRKKMGLKNNDYSQLIVIGRASLIEHLKEAISLTFALDLWSDGTNKIIEYIKHLPKS